MFAVTVVLLDSTFHADSDGTRTAAEWCPSPARLLASLVAAGNGPDGPGWDVLESLYEASAPMVYADPHPHEEEVIPSYAITQGSHQSVVGTLPGRTATLPHPSMKVSVADPEVVFVWPRFAISEEELAALAWRAARIGYLGRSDSQVRVTVSDMVDQASLPDTKKWQPLTAGDNTAGCHIVNVGGKHHLQGLLYAHTLTDSRDRRSAQHRGQPKCWYRPPMGEQLATSGGQTVWFTFDRPITGRAATLVSAIFKRAVLSRYAKDWSKRAPDWLHQHVDTDGDYQLSRYLVLPDCGRSYSNSQIYGAALWIPSDSDPQDVDQVRATLANLHTLRLPGYGSVAFAETDPKGSCKWAVNPRRWEGPARHWVTALPALSDRHPWPDAEAVVRWLKQAGLPDPVRTMTARLPMLLGAIDLAPCEVARPERIVTKPYCHAMFEFAEPVIGPIVIGGARSYGLGLCAPLRGNAK